MSIDPTKTAGAKVVASPFKIKPLKTDHRYIKVVIYGPFGSGKTSLAASSVDVEGMEDVLMVNAESGTLSVEDAPYINNRYYIDRIDCTDFKTVALVQEFLVAHCKARDDGDIARLKALQARTFGYPADIIDTDCDDDEFDADGAITKARLRKYRTVIVDSLTEIDTYSMYQLLNIQTDMKLDKEMEVAEWAEYRKNNQMMQLLVRAYRDLPMNVILVCSAQFNQDEMKRMYWVPSLTGKLAAQVQGFVDIVGYLAVGTPKEDPKTKEIMIPRRLWVQPVGQWAAKSRIASFKDPGIDQPTFGKIMAAFKNAQFNKPNAQQQAQTQAKKAG